MTWSFFYIIVAGLITAIVVTVSLPWLRSRNQKQTDQLRNTQIVKQRLAELEREASEGLISEDDKTTAITELKLALVDEVGSDAQTVTKHGAFGVIVGLLLAFGVAIPVYWHANHIEEVQQLVSANESVGELSQKLIGVMNGQADISPQELQSLALAIRQRLRNTPDDEQAWLNLGRLYLSIGFSEQSTQAFEKAFALAPEDPRVRLNFAQALMLSGTDEDLQRSKRLLEFERQQQPSNDNVLLMLTVVTAQLGEGQVAAAYFEQIKPRLSPQSDMYQSIVTRLEELGVETESNSVTQTAITGFEVTIDADPSLTERIPTDGWIFVFAQDAGSEQRLPAAVVKRPITTFPLTLQLTSEDAMLDTFTLDSIQLARIVVRLSQDEDVGPSSGELQGMTEIPVTTGQLVSTTVTIEQVIE